MTERNMNSLYEEMMQMRDHLLTRIELLESDVELLTKENMEYAKNFYDLENYDDRINILFEELTIINKYEGQESSKTNYQTSKETS